MNLPRKLLSLLGALAIMLLSAATPAGAAGPAESVLLIATDRLEGSGYSETVLIAVPLRDGRHIGFILNRPTPVKLGALFPEHAPSRKVVDPVYFGGPVLAESLFAVARRAPEGGDAIALMPGLVLAVDAVAVDRMIETMPNDHATSRDSWPGSRASWTKRSARGPGRYARLTRAPCSVPTLDRYGRISTPVPKDRASAYAHRVSSRPSPDLLRQWRARRARALLLSIRGSGVRIASLSWSSTTT
jgi:hypothetical protein